jgi:BirA family biotin operon repressor/biotin-[acetyl-CoA-carboxylase] ligase
MELGSLARARGVRLLELAEVDSTNEEAKRLIAAGEGGPLWIVALRQTRGRGRLGRSWISEPGNLYASFILSNFGATSLAPQLGFVAGVAALAAARDASGAGDRLALKWPNDLLLDGAKAGGILLEGVTIADGALAAVIGVGVNCATAPENLAYEAKALAALGVRAPDAATLFSRLTDHFIEALDLWREGEGFAHIRERWLAGAAGLGGPIRVTLARGETLEGRFETIDAGGRLVLATSIGQRIIDAGDVFLPRDGATFLEKSKEPQ